MRFRRTRIESVAPSVVRALGARVGWLVESPEVLRCGFGGTVYEVPLPEGLDEDGPVDLGAELEGDDGPAGSGVIGFAALPFDRSAEAKLSVPRFVLTLDRDGGAWITERVGSPDWRPLLDEVAPPRQEPLTLRSVTYDPAPEEYAHQVAIAVERLRRGDLAKVVLARSVSGTTTDPIDPAALAARLRGREPYCTIYALPTLDGRRFVGASPELLVRRTGSEVLCHPLAGTIALPPNVAPDDYETWLLGSTKNLHEHAILVDDIVSALEPAYHDVHADATPSIVTLRTVAHLGTWITASSPVSGTAPDAISLLRRLHPTAAVGGLPRATALSLISALEGRSRGHYAGPVGWVDDAGDGEWWIGIRGVQIRERAFEAWAGAGIVSESDPIAEREETRDKLASVLSALLVDRI